MRCRANGGNLNESMIIPCQAPHGEGVTTIGPHRVLPLLARGGKCAPTLTHIACSFQTWYNRHRMDVGVDDIV